MQPLTNKNFFWMGTFAIIGDLLSLIPFVGDFVAPIIFFLTNLYLLKKGRGFLNGKRGVTSIVSTIIEMVPGVQALPAISAGMLIIISTLKAEDKLGVSLHTTKTGMSGTKMSVAGRREPPPRIPVNQGNVRAPNGGLTSGA